MTAGQLATGAAEVQGLAGTVLTTIEAADPAAQLPAAEAGAVVALLAQMVAAAANAWSVASGTPITAASITALLPDSTPLPEPPAGS